LIGYAFRSLLVDRVVVTTSRASSSGPPFGYLDII